MVGRIDKDGTVHPYDLTFYFKTGVKDSKDSNNFKDKRKNAKDNDSDKLCSYKNDEDKKLFFQAEDNACGVLVSVVKSWDWKRINIKRSVFRDFLRLGKNSEKSLFLIGMEDCVCYYVFNLVKTRSLFYIVIFAIEA